MQRPFKLHLLWTCIDISLVGCSAFAAVAVIATRTIKELMCGCASWECTKQGTGWGQKQPQDATVRGGI